MLWSDVIPLRAILFQGLFILVAIAAESPFYHYFFQFSWQKSVEVSSVINLFAVVFGWLIIFNAIDDLSLSLKQDLIQGIFLTQVSSSLRSLLVIICSIMFFALWVAKMAAFISLEIIKEFSPDSPSRSLQKMEEVTSSRKLLWMLGAHSASYSLIILMMSLGGVVV